MTDNGTPEKSCISVTPHEKYEKYIRRIEDLEKLIMAAGAVKVQAENALSS